MKPRVYADTSVLGGCEDEEFREPSARLIKACAEGRMTLVVSELTLRELDAAPLAVRQTIQRVPAVHVEVISISAEAEELASAYVNEGAIGAGMRADALHIALATISKVDVLASWNFKHIVNLRRIHAFNAVNLKRGYPLLEIRTPREVPDDE